MARDKVQVLLPTQEETQSVEVGKITPKAVTQANGIEIENAFDNKNNSLQIFVENTTAPSSTPADSELYIKAGNVYPNAMLGDLKVDLTKSAITVVIIDDLSRFEDANGSVLLDFKSGFTGNVWAVAKRTGLAPAS